MRPRITPGFRFTILFTLCVFYGNYTSAQEFGYKNFTVADGLPSSIVYCISKDKDGRLWFGTQNGVSIFNGNTFKNLGRDEGLSETEIFLLFHDSKDRAWFCSFGNSIWYYNQDKIHCIKESAGTGTFDLTYTRSIFEDKKGDIWYSGRKIFRIQNDTAYKIFSKRNFITCYNIFYNKTGILNVVTDRGFQSIVHDSLSDPEPTLVKDHIPFRGACRIGDAYYFITANRIQYYKFNVLGQVTDSSIFTYKYDINRIKSLDGKNIWLLTEGNGALFINTSTSDTLHFLPDKSVSDVILDDDNNYWFSTLDKGIFKINRSKVRVFNKQGGLASDEINTVTIGRDKTILAGTSKGIINTISDLNISSLNFGLETGHNRILDIKSDQRGCIFIASDNGLFSYNELEKKFRYMFNSPRAVKCVYVHSDSVIYAGSSSSYYRINTKKIIIENEWVGRTTAISEFDKNKILIGNLTGLYFGCDDSAGIFKLPGYELNEKINYIVKDKNNIVWVATHSDGIYAFDGNRKIHFTTSNGLLSNACKHIFIDQAFNDIWVSTNQGLNKIESAGIKNNDYLISGFTMEDGLPSNEINQVCVNGNDVWIATNNGLARMQNIDRQPVRIPKIFIRQVRVSDSVYTAPTEVDFSYRNNSLSIIVEGISFSAGKRISYKYKLADLENNWNYTSDNIITYKPVPPGNYELQVCAVHPYGFVESLPATIKINIHGPFWKEPWFLTSIAIMLTSLIILVYRRRLARIRKDSEMKNHLLQLEITSIRAQMNPHFIFNSLNSIQDFIFKNQKELANEYLSSFSVLMRMVLDNSTKNFIGLDKEIEFLKLYLKLEQLRLNNKFQYYIETTEDINMWATSIPTMILQPLLENAIIHGIGKKNGNGNITVKFNGKDEKTVVCIVEDDGVGIKNVNLLSASTNAFQHKSFGMHAISERIKILNSMNQFHITLNLEDLMDHAENSAGTRVKLSITSF